MGDSQQFLNPKCKKNSICQKWQKFINKCVLDYWNRYTGDAGKQSNLIKVSLWIRLQSWDKKDRLRLWFSNCALEKDLTGCFWGFCGWQVRGQGEKFLCCASTLVLRLKPFNFIAHVLCLCMVTYMNTGKICTNQSYNKLMNNINIVLTFSFFFVLYSFRYTFFNSNSSTWFFYKWFYWWQK